MLRFKLIRVLNSDQIRSW